MLKGGHFTNGGLTRTAVSADSEMRHLDECWLFFAWVSGVLQEELSAPACNEDCTGLFPRLQKKKMSNVSKGKPLTHNKCEMVKFSPAGHKHKPI